MGIRTVPQPPYSPDLAPCDIWLFPKPRGCCYETIEEMKEAVTKVIDMLTHDDFHGATQKLLERYNTCIAAGGDYFEGDLNFKCVLYIKEPIRKQSGNLYNDPRRFVYFKINVNAVYFTIHKLFYLIYQMFYDTKIFKFIAINVINLFLNQF